MSCYFNNIIKFKLLYEIEKILDNINNTKNNKYIINPIYFIMVIIIMIVVYIQKNFKKRLIRYFL